MSVPNVFAMGPPLEVRKGKGPSSDQPRFRSPRGVPGREAPRFGPPRVLPRYFPAEPGLLPNPGLPLKLGLPLNDGFGLAAKPADSSGPVTRSISRRGLI